MLSEAAAALQRLLLPPLLLLVLKLLSCWQLSEPP
jgi:hypothetical protein